MPDARRLRPVEMGPVAQPRDIAAIAGILDGPDQVALLPVADPRTISGASIDAPLPAYDEPTVLAVATTGSTGVPKIVLHGESSLRASIDATAARMGGHGQWLLAMPLLHIAGIQVVLRSVVADEDVIHLGFGGADSTVQQPFDIAFARAVGQMTGSRKYTSLVPTQLHRLIHTERGRDALSELDAVLVGGAAADPALVDDARGLGVQVLTTYGMSETAGGCVYDGVPLEGVQVAVEDGVVVLRGPVVAQGYLDPPADDPFRDGGFVTSDIGELVDGRLRVLGRADDVIVTGGKKVAPTRVETALRSLPQILDATVVGVQDAEWGEVVSAALTSTRAGALELDALRDALRPLLESHELPRQVVVVPELPLKGIGKPDRDAVRRLFPH